MLRKSPALLLLVLVAVPLTAQQDELDAVLAGHSQHGEAFNEGPRQAAHLMGTTSHVHFAVTTSVPEAQRFFNQGIGQLHGFWYLEAERSFRQVAALDPDCAMAYWGMAMANAYEASERARGFAKEAWEKRENAGERERLFVDSIARLFGVDKKPKKASKDKSDEASKDRSDKAPKDKTDEASKDKSDEAPKDKSEVDEKPKDKKDAAPKKKEDMRSEAFKKRARRLIRDLEEIVFRYPQDIEAKAFLVNQLWLNQYRSGITISSKAANQALLDQVFAVNPMHPAHHYQIHLWDGKPTAERAVRAALRAGPSAPGIAHMWHMGGHIFARLERHSDAAWQQEASARVDHAQMARNRVMPDEIHNYAHNNEWLSRSLKWTGRVSESLDLVKNMIELPRHPRYNTPEKRGTSSGYGRRRLYELVEEFELWDEALSLEHTPYFEAANEAASRGRRAMLLATAQHFAGEIDAFSVEQKVLQVSIDDLRRERADAADEAEEKAIAAKKKSKEIEEAMTAAMRPKTSALGELRAHARRLEGLVALREDRHEDAIEHFAAAKLTPATHARLLMLAGDLEAAEKKAKSAAKRGKGTALPLARLAEIQFAAGKEKDALATFEELRALSSRFDLEVPPFARLADLAKAAGHDGDWRIPHALAEDIGERPALDPLGPFRWAPSPAASRFELPDGLGERVSLSDFAGRPVLVVFFLGFDCLHCVEQLKALAPVKERFDDLGVSIVCVGTCEEVQVAVAAESDEPYPFRILADPKLEVFREWRAHDDFEKVPLHGTYLLDAAGLVRWQDIGHEPFMEMDFLLGETKRLLALPGVAMPTSAGGE